MLCLPDAPTSPKVEAGQVSLADALAMGTAARNVISGNTYYGIQIAAGSSGNAIRGNYVGPDIAGGRAMGNGRSGIRVESSANSFEAQNVISGNKLDGIVIAGAGASNNVVRGNLIGTTADGRSRLPNGRAGVGISAASRNVIGGTAASEGNVLSANTDAGIYLIDPGATGNQILGNRIGTDVTGATAPMSSPLANIRFAGTSAMPGPRIRT